MAERLSTGLRDQSLETRATVYQMLVASTISFGDGDGAGGLDTINDSANGFAGFKPNTLVTVYNSTANSGEYLIKSVTAGKLEVDAGSFTAESAGDSIALAAALGGSQSDLMRNGVLALYSGAQPATADLAETGTLLALITLSKGAFVAGAAANGLNFDNAASGILSKNSTEVWSGDVLATGTLGWFRFYANNYVTGASSTAVRFDGAISTSGAEMNLPNINVNSGSTLTVDAFTYTRPAA